MFIKAQPHRAFVRADGDAQKVFAMLRYSPRRLNDDRVVPALCICCDTSGSMYQRTDHGVAKIDLAVDVLGAIPTVPGVSAGTEIALIQFDSDSSVLLPLSVLAEDGEAVMRSHAARLRDHNGGTVLAPALTLAEAELAKASPGSVQRIVLLTDGDASDVSEALALFRMLGTAGVSAFCIGLGDAYNEEFLLEVAAVTRGSVAHVAGDDAGQEVLMRALRDELLRSQREQWTNGVATVSMAEGVSIDRADLVYPRAQPLQSADGGYRLPNAAGDDEYVVLFEFSVRAEDGPLAIASIDVVFESKDGESDVGHADVQVRGTAHVALTRDVDEDVMFHLRQRNGAQMVSEAARRSRLGDVAGAQKSLLGARQLASLTENVILDRKLQAAEHALNDQGRIDAALQREIQVTSHMGTMHHRGIGARRSGDANGDKDRE